MPATGRRTSTRDRILDATLAVLAAEGLSGLALEDVAAAAGLSRQTVYRYFGSRHALVSATVLREEEGLIARIAAAAREHTDLEAALRAALAAGLQAAREHPLLDRLLAQEPESLLPFLTTGAGPVLSAARPVMEELLAARLPDVAPATCRRLADTITRLFISYAVNPPDDAVEEVAAGLAALLVHPLAGSLDVAGSPGDEAGTAVIRG
jgi:AcrR family transcriptional regulator